eukprot:scaffold121397_cov69-Phaeocystis_antarctica.AAC.3
MCRVFSHLGPSPAPHVHCLCHSAHGLHFVCAARRTAVESVPGPASFTARPSPGSVQLSVCQLRIQCAERRRRVNGAAPPSRRRPRAWLPSRHPGARTACARMPPLWVQSACGRARYASVAAVAAAAAANSGRGTARTAA